MDALQRRVLSEQLADSLRRPLPEYTARRVFGRLSFAGKATAVTGIRRAGKTAFLHRMRRRLVDRGVPRERLPYLSFEDERLAAAAGAMFPGAGKRLLTLVRDGIPDDLPAGVVAQPACEWLLAPPDE